MLLRRTPHHKAVAEVCIALRVQEVIVRRRDVVVKHSRVQWSSERRMKLRTDDVEVLSEAAWTLENIGWMQKMRATREVLT